MQNNSTLQTAAYDLARRNQNNDIGISEMFLCILAAMGSLSTHYMRRVASAIVNSGTPEGRERYDLLGDYTRHGIRMKAQQLIDNCNHFDHRLITNSRNASTTEGHANIEESIADMLDATDEMLKPYIDSISEYFWRKIPKTGHLHPLDAWLLHDMMLTAVIVMSQVNLYDKASEMLPIFEHNKKYHGYFNFRPASQRVDMLLHSVKWLNDDRKPLQYNIDAVTDTPELLKIMHPLRDALLSTKFIDTMFFIREGIDNEFRYKCPALCEGIPYSRDLNIDKWLKTDPDKLIKH